MIWFSLALCIVTTILLMSAMGDSSCATDIERVLCVLAWAFTLFGLVEKFG